MTLGKKKKATPEREGSAKMPLYEMRHELHESARIYVALNIDAGGAFDTDDVQLVGEVLESLKRALLKIAAKRTAHFAAAPREESVTESIRDPR